MEDLQAHAVSMAFQLGLPSALLRYNRLSEEEKEGPEGSSLIVNGRAFLIAHMWTALSVRACQTLPAPLLTYPGKATRLIEAGREAFTSPKRSSGAKSTFSRPPFIPSSPQIDLFECESQALFYRKEQEGFGVTLGAFREVEVCIVMRAVYSQLGPGQRITPPT